MKFFVSILMSIFLSESLWAEIYETPEYQPDENHNVEEMQKEEEREKASLKKKTEVEKKNKKMNKKTKR